MFVATHKDLVCQQDVSNKRAQLLNTLSACFTDENIQSHIMLQHLFFVNALNENDPEMEELRECISTTITENPQWGQKVPKQFLILEMMLAALVEEGKIIIPLEDAEKMNSTTGVKPLSTTELGLFLGVQNICGKMTYIDYPQLRNYIVIDPTCLIAVLKSIVTSVPVIASLHQGRLTKSDLTNIWSSGKFSHFLQHEEYFRQLLVHYDILSEVRRYDRESGKKIYVDRYLVPCMITTQNTTTFVEKHLTSGKCISFAFEFIAADVPDAIPCRLISSILSIWNVKSYENVDLLFSGFVAVVLDRKHDLVVKTEHNTVAVYIVHKDRKELIIKDLASCVIEVLEQNLAKISEVYSLSFKSDNITQRYVPFHVKLKSGCLSPNCLLDAEDVNSIETYWVCDDHRYITPKSELEIWYTDRTNLQCTDSCQVLLDDVCRHGWVHFRDRCYMFATEKETWTNAEFRCRVFGGHLAEIEHAETNKFLKDTAQMRNGNDQRHHYFIGLTDEALLDEWEWVESATKPNFTDWGNHQPDHNGNDEHCVLFYARDHYRWHDADCDYHNYFICEEEEVNSGGSIIG
ncbi:uncharacterized protein LOC143052684 [Mytilus galloprovincialis]|uniref:uncharacterized protein LOC143052684 n=1 Tax=Mytilus galloprovincialis TaxID=29158 RepID=UPI003F7BEBD1